VVGAVGDYDEVLNLRNQLQALVPEEQLELAQNMAPEIFEVALLTATSSLHIP
jgi:hypothetical protein